MTDPQKSTSGVQELIDRLSQEGVAEGEKQAAKIVEEARQQARQIVDAAQAEADKIVADARREADHFRQGGQEALQLACRDAVRDLASRLHEGFRQRLQDLVANQLRDPQLLRQVILEIARKSRPQQDESHLLALLPLEAVGETEIRQRLQAGEEDALSEFVKGLLSEDIRSGLDVQLASSDQTGLRVRVVEENVEIDLTDEAVTELLAKHLLPRYRALLRD